VYSMERAQIASSVGRVRFGRSVVRIRAKSPLYRLYFDGASRGNPGVAGIGFVLYDENGHLIEEFSKLLGYDLTNNAAEYKALIAGLQHALNLHITSIVACGDSELVCKQVNGEYKVKNAKLRRYHNTVCELLEKFQTCSVVHIRREQNRAADALANEGIEGAYVDKSPTAVFEIKRRCATPQSTKEYIMEKRCEGTVQLRFILDTIQHSLPKSYAAVQELSSEVEHEMGMCSECQVYEDEEKSICMCCILAMS
ncbi:hypothetical protein KI387_015639, partial [Taxus chinensis]